MAVLTAADIKALRACNSRILFHHLRRGNKTYDSYIRGTGEIMIKRTIKAPKGFEGCTINEAEYCIPCKSSISTYRHDEKLSERLYAMSSKDVYQSYQTVVVSSLGAFLKVGDDIELEFIRNNNNENYAKVGFVRDELELSILRGKQRLRIAIDVFVGPADSCARITREF